MSDAVNTEKTVVEPYDFRHAEHLSKRQLQACNAVHTRAAANFAAVLSECLGTTVAVSVSETTQSSYLDFVSTLSKPTCYSALSMKPLDGSAALEVPPEILFPIIERLLGGSGTPLNIGRPMTEIEGRIAQYLVRLLAESLKQSWASVCTVEFSLAGIETDADQLQIISPSDPVMSVEFQVQMADVSGRLRLAIPMAPLDPVLQSFDKEQGIKKKAMRDDALRISLRRIPVQIRIETPETLFPIQSLASLQVDDTLVLNQREQSPLLLKVVGKTKLFVQSRRESTQKAFTVIGQDSAAMEDANEHSSTR
jgi:flagellar motor switch protein FliM